MRGVRVIRVLRVITSPSGEWVVWIRRVGLFGYVGWASRGRTRGVRAGGTRVHTGHDLLGHGEGVGST